MLATFAPLPSLAEEPSLAIGGYDPVAYFTLGSATKGDPKHEYVWDESRYLFATAEDRKIFKANPGQYAPQFGGLCAIALADGTIVESNPEHWLITDGKLYLFRTSAGRDRFSRNLRENIEHANNWRWLTPAAEQ
jgi:hypothetical protein